jgi:dTMP kinase
MRGKLIVIEGTDSSGKQTQSDLLTERLKDERVRVERFAFPNYNSPTGKIIGGPYLGKLYISNCWFPEGADNVDPKVASLYYAADRLYNSKHIEKLLEKGYHIILDRYVTSNMGHQGGKIKSKEERLAMYEWLNKLEYEMLGIPKADIVFFLHMPYTFSLDLKKERLEALDQHEVSEDHMKRAERAYLELADLYKWVTVECVKNKKIRTIEDVHEEIYQHIMNNIK